MTAMRGNVIWTDEPRYEVLDLVSIALPGHWWWHTEDMSEPRAVGAMFRCFEPDGKNEIGYLLVADVSQDPEEPDISTCEDSCIPDLDGYLEREIRSLMERDGRELIRWMSSHLNRRPLGKALVTAYIARDRGRDRQYIDVRTRVRQRNVVIADCFDVTRAEQLAKPFFLALRDARPLG
jgi:hypothetical protein